MHTPSVNRFDVYPATPGYAQPPLPPLPDLADDAICEEFGMGPGRWSRLVLVAMARLTGLSAFLRELPSTLESLLRHYDWRDGTTGPINAATMLLDDDPGCRGMVRRAASLVAGAYSFFDDLRAGRLPPDQYAGRPLEMGQYFNLFGTHIVLDSGEKELRRSANVSRITVLYRERLYALDLGALSGAPPGAGSPAADPGTTDPAHVFAAVEAGLSDVIRRAQAAELGDAGAGLITACFSPTQVTLLEHIRQLPQNLASLDGVRESFLTVCLDETSPQSDDEAATAAHIGHCSNRWFGSSLQLVVFANAKACVIASFNAYLDGNTMGRGASEIRARGCEIAGSVGRAASAVTRVSSRVSSFVSSQPSVEPLPFQLDRDVVQKARDEVATIRASHPSVYVIRGYGRRVFEACNVPITPAFALALQLAACRLYGAFDVKQFLSMSAYRCMGVRTISVTTPEVMAFVDACRDRSYEPSQALALLNRALTSHVACCRRARNVLPVELVLRMFWDMQSPARRRYSHAMLRAARRLAPDRRRGETPPREILISQPHAHAGISLFGRPGAQMTRGRRLGLHYQFSTDATTVTIVPLVGIDTEKLFDGLQTAMAEIVRIAGADVVASR